MSYIETFKGVCKADKVFEGFTYSSPHKFDFCVC
jgi:hypothetical protein